MNSNEENGLLSQKQLNELVCMVPCGICLYKWEDGDLHPLFVNPQFSEMLGENALEYLQKVKELQYTHVHPDDLQRLREASYEALTKTGEIDITYRSLNAKTNEYLWIRMRGRTVEQPDKTTYVYVSYYDVSQEHEKEQMLRESEQMLEFAADHAGLLYWRYDAQKDCGYLDYGKQKTIELPPIMENYVENVLKTGMILPEYENVFRDAFQWIKKGEKQVIFEAEMTLADGSVHWARFCLTNMFNDNGTVTTTVCTASMIDAEKELWAKYELERKKAAMKEDNLLAHVVVNLTTGDILEYPDANGNETSSTNLDGFAFGEQNTDLLIDEQERKQFLLLNQKKNLMKQFAKGETEFKLDYRRKLHDGGVNWIRSTIRMIRDPRSNDVLLFEYWYDIEEEKMLELMYSSLAYDNYEFVIRVNAKKGRFVNFPKEGVAEGLLPLRGEDIDTALRILIETTVHPDDRELAIENVSLAGMKKSLKNQERFQFIFREQPKEDSIRYKRVTVYYLDRQREILMITREDVTEILHLEAEKNEMLATALEAANQASHAKSQFLSRISHELRTPLNAIIGFMELAKGEDRQQVEKYLTNSDIAAKQLLSIINDVLDMSSIESGKMKIAHTPFDMRNLISSITNIFLSQCQEKGLNFETKILTPMHEWLMGDQLRVNQILINLLNNAVKFTDQGHVWLSIKQISTKNNQVFLRFVVQDTGCGMSEEMQERLFKPFEQESAATAQKYGGSGLGLSIVGSLVSMMNGVIRVESAPGVGSTFTVDLPFAKGEETERIKLPESAENMRVLAVDDEEDERKYLSIVLGRMGVRHTCVGNGYEALEKLEKSNKEKDPYNVCLIDWKMPNINGIETTRLIRDKYGKSVIVIVVSAYEHNQADESAREAGANMFIAKPLFQSTLLDLFMTLTGGRIAPKNSSHITKLFTNKRVLLAEDNAMNRLVAEGLVKKLGIACDSAEDGQEVVDKFLQSKPGYYDAILMDIQMPKLDGFEATVTIRESEHPDASKVQIIALTANAFNEDIAKTLSAGMNAHVAKPIEPAMLEKALDEAFSLK